MTRINRTVTVIAALCLGSAAIAQDAAGTRWDRRFYDLGGERLDLPPPDLLLPLPCGGAMGFQRVAVSADARDPVDDLRVMVGQTGTGFGYMDMLRNDHLRGAFTDAERRGTHYYISRYELTELQHASLTNPGCDVAPSIAGLLPKMGLTWFDATDLARQYTEWLLEHDRDALPHADGQPGFLRLPTEAEWEFAARGGAAVDTLEYRAPRPSMDEPASYIAQFEQTAPSPAGAHAPNALGLFDMLGNAEELMLEPFRLSTVGHAHGQGGGVVTRGGSFRSTEADMRSARRSEWPPYNARSGQAQRQDSFGVRFVLSAPVLTGDARVDEIEAAWSRTGGERGATDPEALLAELIELEPDPGRKLALEGLQTDLRDSRAAAEEAAGVQLRSTLSMATVINMAAKRQDRRYLGAIGYIKTLEENFETTLAEGAPGDPELLEVSRANARATLEELAVRRDEAETSRESLLNSYAEALELLAVAPAEARQTVAELQAETLENRGDDERRRALAMVLRDIPAFEARPDMDINMLLERLRMAP